MIVELTSKEQTSFISLLTYIAAADGEINEDEKIFLDDYRKKLGINSVSCEQNNSLQDILSAFEKYESKISVLQELIKLAMIDGHYADAEKLGVENIAQIMDIPITKVRLIEDWVYRGIEWLSEGKKLQENY